MRALVAWCSLIIPVFAALMFKSWSSCLLTMDLSSPTQYDKETLRVASWYTFSVTLFSTWLNVLSKLLSDEVTFCTCISITVVLFSKFLSLVSNNGSFVETGIVVFPKFATMFSIFFSASFSRFSKPTFCVMFATTASYNVVTASSNVFTCADNLLTSFSSRVLRYRSSSISRSNSCAVNVWTDAVGLTVELDLSCKRNPFTFVRHKKITKLRYIFRVLLARRDAINCHLDPNTRWYSFKGTGYP